MLQLSALAGGCDLVAGGLVDRQKVELATVVEQVDLIECHGEISSSVLRTSSRASKASANSAASHCVTCETPSSMGHATALEDGLDVLASCMPESFM